MARRTNAEVCREQYVKHREKRLAAKKAERAADPERARAYQRAMYAKHREKRVALAREYRRKNQAKIAVKAMERYRANRAEINARRIGYRKKHYAKIYARIQKWRKQNPDKEAIYHAKRVLAEQTGLRVADIPNDIAEAKLEQLKFGRLAREASAIEARRAATTGAVHESAVPKGDAQ